MSAVVTDADVITFALANVNEAELAAYTGTSELLARVRLNRARVWIHRYGDRGSPPPETIAPIEVPH